MNRQRERMWSVPRRTRLYAAAKGRPRARRATDVVLLGLCAMGLLLFGQLADPSSDFERALIDLVRAVPSFLDVVWLVGIGLLNTWAVVLVVASLVRTRWDILRDQVIAVLIAGVLVEAVAQAIDADLQSAWQALRDLGPPAELVSARVALVMAVTVVASPHVARPFRTTSRWLVGFGALSLVMLEATTPMGAVIGAICGAAAGAVAHLLFGSSGGHPALSEVRAGLDDLGVAVSSLEEAHRQRAGVFTLDGTDAEGRPLLVKVYGRDAWDAQLLAKGWRALWYRDAVALTLTRVQQAEHEGFVTLLAAKNGVAVHEVLRAGRTADNDAIIAIRLRGVEIDADSPFADVVVDRLIDSAWTTVLALGDAGLAHGDIAPSRFRLDGDEMVIDGLAAASVAASGDQYRVDHAQMLVTSALIGDPELAVAAAARRLGVADLALLLPYLQRAALGARLRADVARDDFDLDALRALAAERAGVEEPKLAQLRRVSPGTLFQAALFVLGGYFLVSSLAGVDLQELMDALRDANLALVLLALVWCQLPRLVQAESTRIVSPRPLPFGPLALLQFAISFVNLVVPSTAARVAVNIRFFQKQGIPPASAVSIGALDGFCGFLLQVLVLLAVVLFGFGDLDIQLDRPNVDQGGLLRILLVLLAIAVVAALGALLVPKARRWLWEKIQPWFHEALETVATLRSPSRVARVLGANLLAEVLFASGMAIVLGSLGVSVPLSTLIVINVGVSLFAGLMPIPGGIGVTEGAFVLGLTSAGVDDATALAATMIYRMCTFYLPPIWGGIAFRRLERQGLL